MSNVDEIAARAVGIGENASRVADSLDYEARMISDAMQRIQATFGDQQSGQEAVLRLNGALSRVITAGSAMRNETTHGIDFVAKLRS